MWLKYRHNSAASKGEWEWEYWRAYSDIESAEKERDSLEEYLVDQYRANGGYTYFDRYRGVELEFHEKAPRDVTRAKIRSLVERKISIEETIVDLQYQLAP